MIERNIGDVFVHKGVILEVIAYNGCNECFFVDQDCDVADMHCAMSDRKDNTGVVFRQVSKPSIELISEPVAPPMFSKRETIALELMKAFILSPQEFDCDDCDRYTKESFFYADAFIKESEKTK